MFSSWPRIETEKLADRALILAGGSSVILGLIGIGYNAVTLFLNYSPILQDLNAKVETPHFYTAFYVMSGICVALYMGLVVVGIQLLGKRPAWAFGLLAIVVLEVLYYLAIGAMWRSAEYGLSVAAATGVSSGGLSFQVFVLFPIWGPWIALWGRRQINYSV